MASTMASKIVQAALGHAGGAAVFAPSVVQKMEDEAKALLSGSDYSPPKPSRRIQSDAALTIPRLLKIRDVAEILGVGIRTAWQMLSDGRLYPADIRFGGRKGNRWRADRFRAWLNANCPKADAWVSWQRMLKEGGK